MEGSITQLIEKWSMNRIVYLRNKMLAINKHRGSLEEDLLILPMYVFTPFRLYLTLPIGMTLHLFDVHPMMICDKFCLKLVP